MPYDPKTRIQTYVWTPYEEAIKFGNTLPFYWKCVVCGTITEINEHDPAKTYECSNIQCKTKLKFTAI